MKQLRSRFRLISLLLVCAFLLTVGVCAGSALKAAGISLSSLPVLPVIGSFPSPDPSVSPEGSPESSPGELPTPAAPEASPAESVLPGTDISPEPEYNIYGL